MWSKIIKLGNHPVIDFACEELSGASARSDSVWPITAMDNELQEGSIIVGTYSAFKLRGWFPAIIERAEIEVGESFLIAQADSCVIIAGHHERTVLYAVYQFCKEYWGENWIYPGTLSISMRRSHPLPDYQSYAPQFQRRGFVFETINDPAYITSMIDWLAKNRINEVFFTFMLWDALKETIAPEIIKRGLMVTLGGHSMKFFLDKAHAALPSTAAHPYTTKQQLDYQDNNWQRDILQSIADYCKAVPNLSRISLWPEDVAAASEQDGGSGFLGSYVEFTDRLKAAITRNGIQAEVEHIVYNAGLSWGMLERLGLEPSHAVDTLFAYWGRDYRYSIGTSPQQGDMRAEEALNDWLRTTKGTGKELTVFEYYSDHFMLTPLFPVLSQCIISDIQAYRRIGVDGLLNLVVPNNNIEHYPWKWIHGNNSYVFCRAAWGDSADAILQDYYTYYAVNERERIRSLFDQVEAMIPVVTSWNSALFPARMVDPETAHASSEQIKTVVSELQEMNKHLTIQLEQSSLVLDHPVHIYVRYLINYAKELQARWTEKTIE